MEQSIFPKAPFLPGQRIPARSFSARYWPWTVGVDRAVLHQVLLRILAQLPACGRFHVRIQVTSAFPFGLRQALEARCVPMRLVVQGLSFLAQHQAMMPRPPQG